MHHCSLLSSMIYSVFFTPAYSRRWGHNQVYLVSRHIPDRTQRWRWHSCFAVQQQKCFIKFWAINKTEVQKIDIEVEVKVSGWLWFDQRPYFCPNQDPEAIFLDFEYYQNLSKYQVLLFRVFFSSANCISTIWVLEYDFVQQIPAWNRVQN